MVADLQLAFKVALFIGWVIIIMAMIVSWSAPWAFLGFFLLWCLMG